MCYNRVEYIDCCHAYCHVNHPFSNNCRNTENYNLISECKIIYHISFRAMFSIALENEGCKHSVLFFIHFQIVHLAVIGFLRKLYLLSLYLSNMKDATKNELHIFHPDNALHRF